MKKTIIAIQGGKCYTSPSLQPPPPLYSLSLSFLSLLDWNICPRQLWKTGGGIRLPSSVPLPSPTLAGGICSTLQRTLPATEMQNLAAEPEKRSGMSSSPPYPLLHFPLHSEKGGKEGNEPEKRLPISTREKEFGGRELGMSGRRTRLLSNSIELCLCGGGGGFKFQSSFRL